MPRPLTRRLFSLFLTAFGGAGQPDGLHLLLHARLRRRTLLADCAGAAQPRRPSAQRQDANRCRRLSGHEPRCVSPWMRPVDGRAGADPMRGRQAVRTRRRAPRSSRRSASRAPSGAGLRSGRSTTSARSGCRRLSRTPTPTARCIAPSMARTRRQMWARRANFRLSMRVLGECVM